MMHKFVLILFYGTLFGSVVLVLMHRTSYTLSPRTDKPYRRNPPPEVAGGGIPPATRRKLYRLLMILAVISIGFAIGYGSGLFGDILIPKILIPQF